MGQRKCLLVEITSYRGKEKTWALPGDRCKRTDHEAASTAEAWASGKRGAGEGGGATSRRAQVCQVCQRRPRQPPRPASHGRVHAGGLDVPVRESLSITPILSCPGIRKVPNSRRTLGSLAETGGTWRVIRDIDHRGHQTPTTGPRKKADGQGERQSAAVTSTLSEVFSGSLSYTLFVLS